MNEAVCIDAAVTWARRMEERECRGRGDLALARERLDRRHALPVRLLWALRYRRPKSIAASAYLRLRAAYLAECERQMRAIEHEAELTRRIAGPDHPAVAAAEAVVGAAGREEEG